MAQNVMESAPVVKLRSLDKVTARTETFEARVGSTVKFGPLYIKVQACRKASPVDRPESAAFLQIWEIDANDQAQWIFSGWMFSSSPALSPMDHPIFDVWVIDCQSDQAEEKKEDELTDDQVPIKPDEAMADQPATDSAAPAKPEAQTAPSAPAAPAAANAPDSPAQDQAQ